MIDFFRRVKIRKYKSVYELITSLERKNLLKEDSLIDYYKDKKYKAGTYEYNILTGKEKVKNKKTYNLNKGVECYFKKDIASIIMICDYFKKVHALEAVQGFESYIFSQDYFDEQKLLGLSILLMRDTNAIEPVKFGILLSRYYQLENAEAAIDIIKKLSLHPEFTYYGLTVLKNLNNYDEIKEELSNNIVGTGKEIEKFF